MMMMMMMMNRLFSSPLHLLPLWKALNVNLSVLFVLNWVSPIPDPFYKQDMYRGNTVDGIKKWL